MSLLDKFVAKVAPPESDEERMQARHNARAQAMPDGWLQLVLDDHERIEAAFDAVRSAPDARAQRQAELELATLLNGHSAAEEAVIYPELADTDQKTHAMMGYEEQAMTKVQLGLLLKLEPMSGEYLDKLEHIRGAVLHHMYQEESSWLVPLERQLLSDRQPILRERYEQEMSRYSAQGGRSAGAEGRSAMSWDQR
jgi:hemerythrin superfamily protein